MAKEDLSVKIGATFVGRAAFNSAEKSIKKLGKQVVALATGGGLLAFGRSSVQAFYESEKSAKALYGTLRNLGLAFKQDDINKYVDKLALATGVVDERLNPALAVLLLNTRDLTKSQQLLGVALDISAATGVDLQQTSTALAKAFTGNRAALGKLNLGFSAAELNVKNFDDLLRMLSYTFDGQAAAAAEGFTGDIDKLKIAVDQFKEAIGRGIAKGLTDTTGDMNKTADAINNIGNAFGKLIELNLKYGGINLFSADFYKGLLATPKSPNASAGFTYSLGARADQDIADSRSRRLAAQRLKIDQQQLKAQQKILKAQQDQAKIKKSQGILDIEQAGIIAALQGKISENERLRLELQLALLTGNAKEADRLSNELLISQARITGLASFIANLPKALNPFADYPMYVQMALAELAKLKAAQDALARNQNATPVKTLEEARSEAVSSVARVNEIYTDLMSKIMSTTKNGSPTIVQNNYISGATQGLLDELNNGLINNSASGTTSSLNRLGLIGP
jgi:hypothetical protein